MGTGGNGNNQWEWERNENNTRLNRGLGMGMGTNRWEWERMRLKKIFPLITNTTRMNDDRNRNRMFNDFLIAYLLLSVTVKEF